MSNKTRQRKDKGRADDELKEEDLMDSAEQSELIKRMRDDNEKQNRWSRTVFCLLGFVLGIVKIYYASSQFFYPWEIQPHTLLMGKVSYDAVATWELFSGFSFILVAYYVNPMFDVNNVDRRWWAWVFSAVFAFTILLLWVFYVGFELSMLLVWFCGGNVIFSLVGLYTEWLIRSSEMDIAGLAAMSYNYQKA